MGCLCNYALASPSEDRDFRVAAVLARGLEALEAAKAKSRPGVIAVASPRTTAVATEVAVWEDLASTDGAQSYEYGLRELLIQV